MMQSDPTNLRDTAFWKRSVSNVPYWKVNLCGNSKFQIQANDKVVSLGTCFAPQLSAYMKSYGLNSLITESAHPMLDNKLAATYRYGEFCARFGNIYTPRQLLQLLQRATGEFVPEEEFWQDKQGNWLDPFRPGINPQGFSSKQELIEDRIQHLACVKKMFAELDVLVITLGLTECWENRRDGAVYPIYPGASGENYDQQRHRFKNLSHNEAVTDLEEFIRQLRVINPNPHIVLMLSPVQLIATFENRSVVLSTTVSKAILRSAFDEIDSNYPEVSYFPAYEFLTGTYTRYKYFSDDGRTINGQGVNKVMTEFIRHYCDADGILPTTPGLMTTFKEKLYHAFHNMTNKLTRPSVPPAVRRGDQSGDGKNQLPDDLDREIQAFCDAEMLDDLDKSR